MTPTYGSCAYCGAWGPLAPHVDAPPDACMPCAVVIVTERSDALAALFVGGDTFVTLLTSAEMAALN